MSSLRCEGVSLCYREMDFLRRTHVPDYGIFLQKKRGGIPNCGTFPGGNVCEMKTRRPADKGFPLRRQDVSRVTLAPLTRCAPRCSPPKPAGSRAPIRRAGNGSHPWHGRGTHSCAAQRRLCRRAPWRNGSAPPRSPA